MFKFFKKFDFLFSRAFKIYLIVTGLVGLAAVFVVVMVFMYGSGSSDNGSVLMEATQKSELLLDDFILPENYNDSHEPTWLLSRKPTTRWSAAEIEKFWQPPLPLSLEILEQRNQELIKDILADAP